MAAPAYSSEVATNVDQQQPVKTPFTKQRWLKVLIAIVAVIAFTNIMVALAIHYEDFKKDGSSSNSASAESGLKTGGVLMSDNHAFTNDDNEYDFSIRDAQSFGSIYTRDQISSITFSSSVSDEIRDSGIDVSANNDRSVLAWFESNAEGYYDLTIAADGKIVAPTYSDTLFYGYINCKSIDFNGAFDTSTVKSMRYLFGRCESLTSLDVSGLATSQVTEMLNMFAGCISLTSLDLSDFDTSHVEGMGFMFYNCLSLTSIDVKGFDTSKVEDFRYMFSGCSSLKTLDLTSFEISSAYLMDNIFSMCSSELVVKYPADNLRWEEYVSHYDESNPDSPVTFVTV